ncbi:DUF501 domain-containing protein [Paenibacillus sp. TRM 82003]|uniref:DUF501 domain-containing protein n=1 Tax=Kineococcus sp. TRM81007 TaxID=2925831 RepID=UPI001F56F899|nr:DUF501 domain-containing protein [Kineococcus sp. TRM81007]MCI2238405.1 DUF501 domain-containing protein [Kineococcus sp. TRM81007]MCI3922082.1 DUF501 domain-containing protein [Paenibacillus sp. TRM 82003]
MSAAHHEAPTAADLEGIAALLGRVPRGVLGVAHRCSCGRPEVVETAPRLPDGTPFPTTYYLVDPFAASAISTLEASGLMREMTERLAADPELAAAHAAAHEDYLRRRAALGDGEVPEIAGVSAGGMPTRVKCLHALAGHALAAGPGVNPFGDETLQRLRELGGWPATCPHAHLDAPGAAGDGGSAGDPEGEGPGA